jgi:hypothetical protein
MICIGSIAPIAMKAYVRSMGPTTSSWSVSCYICPISRAFEVGVAVLCSFSLLEGVGKTAKQLIYYSSAHPEQDDSKQNDQLSTSPPAFL